MPDGRIIKLERYTFQGRTVRYDLPNRPIARALAKLLPDPLMEKIKWLRPGNHWRPQLDSTLQDVNGGLVVAGFFGALWPAEDAWKMRVEFKFVDRAPTSKSVVVVEFLAKPAQIGTGSESR